MNTVQDRRISHPTLWDDWRWQVKNRIITLEALEKWINPTDDEKKAIRYSSGRLKMAITPHFASLMEKDDPSCPIRRQAVPSLEEFKTTADDLKDPCDEEKDTVATGLVHRYPDRVLLLITNACAVYCRHCTRRRMEGFREGTLTNRQFEEALHYIAKNRKIRDVLISGGDPLLLPDEKLNDVLQSLKAIKHLEIIRIDTRLPVTLPQRITDDVCAVLKKYHPLFINIHFNHTKEISSETQRACARLADAGIPLGSQTVLLKGINDIPATMIQLMHKLLTIRVKPYYLYQCDLAMGTDHFHTPVSTGINIIESMQGYTTGYAVPTLVINTPGGGGTVPVHPDTVVSRNRQGIIVKNYQGKIFFYPDHAMPAVGSILKSKESDDNQIK